MKPKYWNKGKAYLSNKDKVLKRIIDQYPSQSLKLNKNSFHALINSIIVQQITVPAAKSMKNKLFSIKKNITPKTIINIKKIVLSICCLSKYYIFYFFNILDFFLDNKLFSNEIV